MRGAIRLGNANNGDNAGTLYLNGNNAPTNANANDGAVHSESKKYKRVSLSYRKNISRDGGESRRYRPSDIPVGQDHRSFQQTHNVSLNPRVIMRRIRDDRENETLENAQEAFERYASEKHKRWNVARYEQDIDENTHRVLQEIIEGSFVPSGYQEKWIYDKKPRKLAKASVYDHHAEAAHMLPYEQQVYDHISWRAPAVRPNLGTHAMMRYIRNCLFRNPQTAVYFYIMIDVHHYFPLMDHEFLKRKISNKFKAGKLRNFIFRVIDSYPQGAPLGIKLAQLFGMLYLADFDRLMERFFDIRDDPEKMAYWTQRYISEWIMTAKTPEEEKMLGRGSAYMAWRFRKFTEEGLKFSFRFVDNILVMHEDKAFLRITRDLIIMTLTRDYRAQINPDYNVRPVWMGIRLVGYTYFHEKVAVAKANKKDVARRAHKLQKLGFSEEEIRIKLASQLGFIKHSDCINLLKTIGMEKSLGKIIKNRRIKPPFKGMNPSQKVPFSSLIVKNVDNNGGGKIPEHEDPTVGIHYPGVENRQGTAYRR